MSLGLIFRRMLNSPAFYLFILTLIIYSICLNGLWATDHTTSFLELAWAISNNHSLALGAVNQSLASSCSNPIQYKAAIECTVDDFAYGGYYYSALAPGTPFLMLPFAAIGFLANGGFSLYAQPLVYSEFSVALANSFATVLVYKISKLYFRNGTSAFLACAYAFSTISWPFATFIFQSDPSSAFDLLAVYCALKLTRSERAMTGKAWKNLLLTGLALSAAVVVDYPNIILLPIFLFYILFVIHRQSGRVFTKNFIIFLLSAFAGIALIAAYNYFSFGNPFATSEQLYQNGRGLLESFSEPLDYGLLLNLFTPYRGLFVYSPILALGLYGYYKMLKSNAYEWEGVFLLAIFCSILFPYSKWYVLDAGLSYGPRFIIPAIPFLLIPVGFVIENRYRRNTGKFVAYGLYAIGVITNGMAALTSALANTETSWLRSPFLDFILPRFLDGTSMDSWILSPAGHETYLIASALIIGLALFLPALFYRAFREASYPISNEPAIQTKLE